MHEREALMRTASFVIGKGNFIVHKCELLD